MMGLNSHSPGLWMTLKRTGRCGTRKSWANKGCVDYCKETQALHTWNKAITNSRTHWVLSQWCILSLNNNHLILLVKKRDGWLISGMWISPTQSAFQATTCGGSIKPVRRDEKTRTFLVTWEILNLWLCARWKPFMCSSLSGDVLSNSLMISHIPISDSDISPKSLRQMYINFFFARRSDINSLLETVEKFKGTEETKLWSVREKEGVCIFVMKVLSDSWCPG